MTQTIYVALLDEGTDVWRPVQAEQVKGNAYRILDSMPEDESWEFPSGAVVHCKEMTLSSGKHLVAYEHR